MELRMRFEEEDRVCDCEEGAEEGTREREDQKGE